MEATKLSTYDYLDALDRGVSLKFIHSSVMDEDGNYKDYWRDSEGQLYYTVSNLFN